MAAARRPAAELPRVEAELRRSSAQRHQEKPDLRKSRI
jgi:hypothetical protein